MPTDGKLPSDESEYRFAKARMTNCCGAVPASAAAIGIRKSPLAATVAC